MSDKIVITGQPPSKSNCYKVIEKFGHGSLCKTKALKAYEDNFYLECPIRERMISVRFRLDIDVYYRSDLPDLDNSLKVILDCLQTARAIKNDRLCAEIHARKLKDKDRPRIEFTLTPLL